PKNALLSTLLFLDQFFWLGPSGIYKVSLYCWMSSSVCTSLVEIGELGRLSASMKKLEKDLKGIDKHENDQYQAKLWLTDSFKWHPKKINPRVIGAFGFAKSLISCYQVTNIASFRVVSVYTTPVSVEAYVPNS
ncbi:Peroxisomal membrane protein 11C, partial [Bienertia sinuspersici]